MNGGCEGTKFLVSSYETLEVGHKRTIQIFPPSNMAPKKPYGNVMIGSTGKGTVKIYENATCTGGTELTPICQDRNLNFLTQVEFIEDPTIHDIGDELLGFNLIPQAFGPCITICFKVGKSSLVQIESVGAGNKISFMFAWNEQ